MKIKFLGASGTVTGSCYVLTGDSGQSILIDLGMFQGTPAIEKYNYEPFEYDCKLLSGAILTHAHLDHCGRLPILLTYGFSGRIHMTPATRDLTELSLLDSAKIARSDNKEFLYDEELAARTIQKFETVQYRTPFQIGDFTVTFRDDGHILGSASLEIVDRTAVGNYRKIVFSGDLGNTPEDLLHETEFIDTADAVVIESTYGDRLHPKADPSDALRSEINAVETSDGTLLIPTFSLDRTQELLHLIKHLKKSGEVKNETPVYMDSPMAQKATLYYMKYSKLFNPHIQDDFKFGSPFDFPELVIIDNWKESQAIHNSKGAKVIIAGSGMMTGGRILGHAAHYLPMPSTRLFIVGYQGDETLGRNLLEGDRNIIIDDNEISVKATVSFTESMSSHADQKQLLNWLSHIKDVKKVFVTHGEDNARSIFAEKIYKELGIENVTLPILNQEVVL